MTITDFPYVFVLATVLALVFLALLAGCAPTSEQKPIVVPPAPEHAQAAAGHAPVQHPATSPSDVKRSDESNDFGTAKVGMSMNGNVGVGVSLGNGLAISTTDGSIMITP